MTIEIGICEDFGKKMAALRQRQVASARSARRKGDAFERAIVKHLEELSYVAKRVRQGGGEIVDVIACSTLLTKPWFVQCRLDGYMTEAEKERLILEAKSANALPILAYRRNRTIVIENLKW